MNISFVLSRPVLLVVSLILLTAGWKSISAINRPVKKYDGMAFIKSKKQSFTMGWDRDEAGTEWACFIGKHKVTFTYNLYMDSTLVTQNQYRHLMHINPSAHQTSDLRLPVENISWYDAVLYCNARSKRDFLDTVYTYSAILKKGVSVYDLTGLQYQIHKNGYRLPTNAEYEYIERANLPGTYFFADSTQNADEIGQAYAWSKFNSEGTTHAVGLKKPHSWGMSDLTGNVFEWCSDWEGPYLLNTQTDPIGPSDGKTECGTHWIGSEKKMAKGGSYKTDIKGHMRINYHYKWPPSTTSGEIGFRCVATVK